MHERRVNIFYGHLVTCGKKINNAEHFLLACRKGSHNILPRKSIGALIGGGGT